MCVFVMVEYKEIYQAFLKDSTHKGTMIIRRELAEANAELYFLKEKFKQLEPFLNFEPSYVEVGRSISRIVVNGGSLAVNIPKHFIRDNFLKKGDNIDVLFMAQRVKK